MSLVIFDKESRSLAKNVGSNFDAWRRDLRLRLENLALSNYVFNSFTVRHVSAAQTIVQDAEQALFELAPVTAGSTEKSNLATTQSKAEAEDRSIVDVAFNRDRIRECRRMVENDRKAWAQVCVGIEGAVVWELEGLSAHDAFERIKKTFGVVSPT